MQRIVEGKIRHGLEKVYVLILALFRKAEMEIMQILYLELAFRLTGSGRPGNAGNVIVATL